MRIFGHGLIGLVIALVAFFAALRFVEVETSPPGFYLDEAAIAAQILCLRDSGHDLHGKTLPLFSEVLGGGYATPPMLYAGAAWTAVFGKSIASFRSLSAFFGVLFVIATYFLSLRIWRSQEAAWLSALCAAISPWAFQFSRISWDPALAPALMAAALALLFAEGAWIRRQAALAGFLAAGAAYSYPPLRVQLALVLPAVFLACFVRDRRLVKRKFLPFVATMLATALPLIIMTLNGQIQGRFNMLSVFNERYLSQFGEPTFTAGLIHFKDNFAAHFSMSYLALQGDANPRHSTGAFGEWSPLDLIALAIAVVLGAKAMNARKRIGSSAVPFLFAAFGYLAGIVPSALTWESNPHALRSIGALVFLALGSGGALAMAWRAKRVWRIAVVTVAIGFSAYFYYDYFALYPTRVGLYFDARAVEAIERLRVEGNLTEEAVRATPELKDYPVLALRYFQQASGVLTCE
ncbi:MAG: glycosyltransferase family 39 protein [Bdellovibrionota bacterium]